MKVVFDTNILLSALIFPGGRGEAALLRIAEEKDQLLLSKPMLDEVLGILARKFSRDAEALARAAVSISDLSLSVIPSQRIHAVRSDSDNRIIECAVAGRADVVVVVEESALLALGEYRGVLIIPVAKYLER